jgi:hypothetical protein
MSIWRARDSFVQIMCMAGLTEGIDIYALLRHLGNAKFCVPEDVVRAREAIHRFLRDARKALSPTGFRACKRSIYNGIARLKLWCARSTAVN